MEEENVRAVLSYNEEYELNFFTNSKEVTYMDHVTYMIPPSKSVIILYIESRVITAFFYG